MKLRRWQSNCLTRALNWFKTQSHFMCLATPGSGKTRLSAELAKSLLQANQVDFVLAFAPSIEVVQNTSNTFTKVLGCRFDGQIGAIGGAYTYQSLLFIQADFWQIFDSHRVLVVLDEVHHCAGSDLSNSNSWGEQVLLRIQNRATFSIALSGTPWRSDDFPIVLAKYTDPEGKVRCDYEYGLADAIHDGVCRNPKLVLIDHDRIRLTNQQNGIQLFDSFAELLSSNGISYDQLIQNSQAVHFMLNRGCQKLKEIRLKNPNAAGLVVARSVEHAHVIAAELSNTFAQSVKVVTYRDHDASKTIDTFRHSNEQWIVSVGMISEGTDIPRLQVCCHLSIVKTEMHFRQVLGRILRMTNDVDKDGWMFVFAEPTLVEFANDLHHEIPESRVVQFDGSRPHVAAEQRIGRAFDASTKLNDYSEIRCNDDLHLTPQPEIFDSEPARSSRARLEWAGQFREQVIATFNSSF